MREADLTRPRHRATADDRRGGRAVMRRPKRRPGDERTPRGQDTGHRVDPRHLERLVASERRQHAG